MKSPIGCPGCGSSFAVGREAEGKNAKCPKCGQRFVVSFSTLAPSTADIDSPPVPALDESAGEIEAIPAPKVKAKRRKGKQTNSPLPQWLLISLPAVATLVVGYFLGREHVKYELRSALSGIAKPFAELGLANDADKEAGAVSPPAKEIPTLTIGETYAADMFDLTVVAAKVGRPEVRTMLGNETALADDPALILTLRFTNTDKRKILQFERPNMFLAGPFKLRDDVGNVIRGVSYGVGNTPVGALTGDEDIAPGGVVEHTEVFSAPPPKTEYLVLTVDLECMGGDGKVEYKIPIEAVSR